MPIREYVVLDDEGCDTDIVFEEIIRGQPPLLLRSNQGHLARLKQVSRPADMHYHVSNQCGTRYGVNGFYNRALGMTVHSDLEADKIANARGYVRESEMPKYTLDDALERKREEYIEGKADLDKFDSIFNKHGVFDHAQGSVEQLNAASLAWEEYMPAAEVLNNNKQ